MEILVDNMSWIFNGVGVFLLGLIISRNGEKKNEKRKPGHKSITMTFDENGRIEKFSFEREVTNRGKKG